MTSTGALKNSQLTDSHRYCAPNENPGTTLSLFPGTGLIKIGRKKIHILHRNALEGEGIRRGREGIKSCRVQIDIISRITQPF